MTLTTQDLEATEANAKFKQLAESIDFAVLCTVAGKARIVDERSVLKSLYQKSDDAWFKGNDDSNLTAIEIDPQAAHYRDGKGSRLVALWRMGVAAITGVQADIVQHGDLKL